MKIAPYFVALLTLAASPYIYAELNDDDYNSQTILVRPYEPQEAPGPFSVSIDGDYIAKTDFEHRHCKKKFKDIEYAQADLEASAVFYYEPCYKEGLLASAGYSYNRIKWKNNYFDQTQFHTANIAIGAFTNRFCNWSWSALVRMNIDLTHFKIWDYFNFNLVLAGRYEYNECVGLHLGFIAFTGMKIDQVYPIIGIDWRINESWKLNLVFPSNISLVYNFTPEWYAQIAARAFDERFRVGPNSMKYSRGLIHYTSAGGELGLGYKSCDGRWEGNIHAGSIIGGKVRVSDRHNRHSHRYPFNAAPYAGFDLAAKF